MIWQPLDSAEKSGESNLDMLISLLNGARAKEKKMEPSEMILVLLSVHALWSESAQTKFLV